MATSSSTATVISTIPELQSFLSTITPTNELYLDLEGTDLSRHGTISIVSILVLPQKTVKLIDVLILGKNAFTAATKDNKTLKSIFENPTITKYLWDVRNDADALWALYQVGLSGVVDIQLLENASRTDDRTYLRGLDVCVQHGLKLPFMEINRFLRIKKDVKNLMSSKIFASRPLDTKTIQYCSNDVVHLPALRAFYLGRITKEWLEKAKDHSGRRVIEAHSATYKPNSQEKKFGPWGTGGNQPRMLLEDCFEQMHDDMMDDDPVGYYDDFYESDGNMAGEAPECMDSCWDKY